MHISSADKKEKPWFLKALKTRRNPFFDKTVRKTGFIHMVREMRLELTRLLPHAPQTCLSTSSSTLAFPIVSESPRSQRQELLYQRLPHLSTQYSDFLKKFLRQVYGQSFHLPCPYPLPRFTPQTASANAVCRQSSR